MSKYCPQCNQDLPLNDFGVVRARSDGRNLYCKACVREKVYAFRSATKQYKAKLEQQIIERRTKSSLEEFDSIFPKQIKERRTKPSLEELDGVFPSRSSRTKISARDRVLIAIRTGARTQSEIAMRAGVLKDELGEALAYLLIGTREIRTMSEGESRYYVPVEVRLESKLPSPRVRSCSLTELLTASVGPQVRGASR